MPQSRVKTQKGGNYEVQVPLPRSVVIDVLLARRRLRAYMASGVMYTHEEYLMGEFVIGVLNGLLGRVDHEVKRAGFTWNIEEQIDES